MKAHGARLSIIALMLGVTVVSGCSRSRGTTMGRPVEAGRSSTTSSAGTGGSNGSDKRGTAEPAQRTTGSAGSGGSGALSVGKSVMPSNTSPGAAGSGAATGSAICPAYQSSCKGACIVTSQDPQNCGSCGHACAATEACSSGVCSPTCTTPPSGGNTQISKCGQLCVDLFNDNNHCGSCDTDCLSTNQVCVGGRCTDDKLKLDPKGKSCPNGGPVIHIDDGAKKTCAGRLAQSTFRWGMCSCGDVSVVSSGESWSGRPGLDVPALFIDAYDSSKGPWNQDKPELGGSLGLNGKFSSERDAFTFVTGNMWSASSIDTAGQTDIKQELHTLGSITSRAEFNIGQPNSSTPPPVVAVVPGTSSWDGFVAGSINASAPLTFHKDLYSQNASMPANVTVRGASNSASVMFPPPCDSCGSSQLPISAIIDHYAPATNNDNAAIGLSSAALSALDGSTRLDLPCGSYYLDSIKAQGSVTVFAHGHTALFIGGDVSADVLSFTLDPSASFDVFIQGTIETQSDLIIGNPNYAALTRTYVAGSQFSLNGEAHIAGLFYAANSDLELQSHLTVYGALYCKSFRGAGDNTDIHYDRAALELDRDCCQNPEIPDAAGCSKTCSSCKDCGNQACAAGTCVSCKMNSDCCAPLVCQSGTCMVPLE